MEKRKNPHAVSLGRKGGLKAASLALRNSQRGNAAKAREEAGNSLGFVK